MPNVNVIPEQDLFKLSSVELRALIFKERQGAHDGRFIFLLTAYTLSVQAELGEKLQESIRKTIRPVKANV